MAAAAEKQETATVSLEEFEKLKAENAALKEQNEKDKAENSKQIADILAKVEALQKATPGVSPDKKDDGKPKLDKKQPYVTHRDLTGFEYVQDGNRFSGSGELLGPVKKGK